MLIPVNQVPAAKITHEEVTIALTIDQRVLSR